MSWNGEGSFLFTSSSAPYDCFDNGLCNEVLYLTVHISCSRIFKIILGLILERYFPAIYVDMPFAFTGQSHSANWEES